MGSVLARDAERDAREARRLTAVRVMARSGYAGSAVLRVLIGVLAILLAAHAPGAQPDASGAFGALARVPAGVVVLFAVAAGEAALGAWLVVAGVVITDRDALERWRQRLVYWGRAVFYGVVATTALRIALGAHDDSSRSEQQAGRHLLDVPGGSVVLALLGLIVVVVGVGMVWVGVSLRFRRTIHLPAVRTARFALVVAGVVEYAARGATIAVVGVFVVIAAFTSDAGRASGLSGALHWLASSDLGRVVLVAVGIGWIVGGAYSVARAFVARLG